MIDLQIDEPTEKEKKENQDEEIKNEVIEKNFHYHNNRIIVVSFNHFSSERSEVECSDYLHDLLESQNLYNNLKPVFQTL